MIIRKASSSDNVSDIILLAARECFESYEIDNIKQCCEYLFKNKNNKFSYQNSYVIEIENKIVGVIICYDSSEEEKLAINQMQLLKDKYNKHIDVPLNEGIKDTYYIDTLAVDESFQGQGIGSKLLNYVTTFGNLSLLVDVNNKNAFNVYTKKGFKKYDEVNFSNHSYYQMIKKMN